MLDKLTITDNGNILEVGLSDGKIHRFHAIWLRDNSQSAETRDPNNGQRLITMSDISADIAVASAELEGDQLSLAFSPDNHTCTFSADWLVANAYDRTA
ncbi:MAG: gamma-butyrobetaine hydroxylase-like domain-containing protein, partial [Paracoccaceae bacterium]|nr:gamma-butyrobetaine hydroxylase-like domain-containing protein [Paracoccaceae bacterium]